MRKILILTFLVTGISMQAQDYMTEIATKACTCLKGTSDTISDDRLYLELGVCMLQAAEPHKKQIKKDYDIDLNNSVKGKAAEKLGEIVGIKMATICPDQLLALSERTTGKKSQTGKTNALSFEGKVIKIEKETFVTFMLKDDEGKTMKFYWLTHVESGVEMVTNYSSLMDIDVRIKYNELELFDAKAGEYRQFNVIESLDQLGR